ncbi:MAG: AraC family transcriptional regulator [Terrimicrobiaceae bacterium]|nr:AraC family transcriptional regulator [Terrimicrobiaceae bacterium]
MERVREKLSTVGAHDHEFVEIGVVLAGHAIHHCLDQDVPLSAGSVFVVVPNQFHSYSKVEGFVVANLYFLPGFLSWSLDCLSESRLLADLFLQPTGRPTAPNPHVPVWRLEADEFEHVRSELAELERESGKSEPFLGLTRAMMLKILLILCRAYARELGTTDGELGFGTPVWRALRLMDEKVAAGESLSIEALARSVGVSVDHFRRVFRKETGLSPNSYFQRLRVQRVAQLLSRKDLTITEAAFSVGFADTTHLDRTFKRWMGITPGEFRRLQ